VWTLVAALFALAACKASSEAARAEKVSKVHEPDEASSDAGGHSSASPEEGLALAAPPGTSVIDTQIGRYESALRERPDNVDMWLLLGRTWVRKARETADPGFYLNADACAGMVLRRAPENRGALDLRSLVLLNDHRFEEARALAQRIVLAHPDDPMGYGSLSDALLELGRFDDAAAAVQKMVDLKPNLPSYSRVAYIHWLKGEGDEALEAARLAIDAGSDPRDPEPAAWQLVQTAMMFWHKGDYAGADAGFDLALARMPEYPPALVGKGRDAMARGEGTRAAELLARAFAGSPLVETAWLLGDARTLSGDAEGALRAYAEVEKEGRLGDRRTLSLYYSTRDEKADRALALVEAERKARGDLYTQDAYAWALHRKGRDEEALGAIVAALAHGTQDARLLFHEGAIRLARGDRATGRKLVAQALALNPGFDLHGVAEARRLLATADGIGR
jgi:tetratricopeptide (TPR) repeat protein